MVRVDVAEERRFLRDHSPLFLSLRFADRSRARRALHRCSGRARHRERPRRRVASPRRVRHRSSLSRRRSVERALRRRPARLRGRTCGAPPRVRVVDGHGNVEHRPAHGTRPRRRCGARRRSEGDSRWGTPVTSRSTWRSSPRFSPTSWSRRSSSSSSSRRPIPLLLPMVVGSTGARRSPCRSACCGASVLRRYAWRLSTRALRSSDPS